MSFRGEHHDVVVIEGANHVLDVSVFQSMEGDVLQHFLKLLEPALDGAVLAVGHTAQHGVLHHPLAADMHLLPFAVV